MPGDVRPIPDPTELTRRSTEAAKEELRREVGSVAAALTSKIEAVQDVLQARLDAMDKAIILLQTTQDRVPHQMKAFAEQLQALIMQRFETQEERFRGIQVQFVERDVRAEQSSTSTRVAIDAALSAQKEMWAAQNTNIAQALARIEATSQKQIEQVVTLSQTTAAAMDGKINDLKERLSLIEGRTAGITAASTSQQAVTQTQQGSSSNIIAVIAIVVGALMGLAGVLMAVMKAP